MSECPRCQREVADGSLCSLCTRDAERALGNVAWLEEQLNLVITRQTRYSAQTEGRAAETPVAFSPVASDAYWTLRNILVGWTRLYAEEAGANLPADTLTAMSRFLLPRCEWYRHHDLAADFVNEIRDATSHAAHIVDSPANRTTFPVGPCPELLDSAQCIGEVRAFIPTDEAQPAKMVCSECGTTYETWQWLRAGRRIEARRAELLPVMVVGLTA